MFHIFNSNDLIKLLEDCGFKNIKKIFCQRYSIENAMHWIINGKPQIKSPSYICKDELKWLNNYYKKRINHKRTKQIHLLLLVLKK